MAGEDRNCTKQQQQQRLAKNINLNDNVSGIPWMVMAKTETVNGNIIVGDCTAALVLSVKTFIHRRQLRELRQPPQNKHHEEVKER
jgi:hypothetical protein